MDEKVKKFVKEQKRMAEKIRENIGANEVEVKFYETFPGMRVGKCMIADNVQKLIPISTLILEENIMKRKLTVEFSFIFPAEKKLSEKKAKDVFGNVVGTSGDVSVHQNILKVSYNKDPHKIMQ